MNKQRAQPYGIGYAEFSPTGAQQPGARPYLHTVEAGAKLPLLQSLVWALITGFSALVAALAGRSSWPNWMLWSAAAFLGGFGLAWMFYQRHWFKLSSLERLLGRDLDNSGGIGDDPGQNAPPRNLHVQVNEVTTEGHLRAGRYFDLPATDAQLESLADGLFSGVTFAERNWTGKGRPFSINGYRELRSAMIKAGLLYTGDKSANQGFQLTASGRAVMHKFLPGNSPTPSSVMDGK